MHPGPGEVRGEPIDRHTHIGLIELLPHRARVPGREQGQPAAQTGRLPGGQAGVHRLPRALRGDDAQGDDRHGEPDNDEGAAIGATTERRYRGQIAAFNAAHAFRVDTHKTYAAENDAVAVAAADQIVAQPHPVRAAADLDAAERPPRAADDLQTVDRPAQASAGQVFVEPRPFRAAGDLDAAGRPACYCDAHLDLDAAPFDEQIVAGEINRGLPSNRRIVGK